MQTLMKDGLGEAAVDKIIHCLLQAGADFSPESFRKDALSALNNLELKDRVRHLILVMHRHLPQSFPKAAEVLHKIRDHWELDDLPGSSTYFAAWPITDYVATHGLNHPDISLPLLRYLTPLYTAEFAIRPFIETHKKQTYGQLLIWCMDSDEHVRRLASEGSRPRLPWGKQLPSYIKDPTEVISLLENLRDDPSDYVRRSVANNLNDISKDHPELVIETCKRWLKDAVPERKWIIKHATRTLIKAGHPEVFPLLGFTAKPQLKISNLTLTPTTVHLGTPFQIRVEITSTSDKEQSIVLDYAIHFMKANGKTTPKVFKWKNIQLKPQQTVSLEKMHPLKAINTRRYYSGEQRLEIMVNGESLSSSSFQLTV